MNGKIKLWRNDGQNKNGYPVKLILFNGKKRKRKKIFSIHEKFWDELRQVPKAGAADFENVYDFVVTLQNKIKALEFKKIDDFEIALNFLLDEQDETTDNFYAYFKKRIDFMEVQNRKGNAKVYRETMIDLKKFEPFLSFDQITLSMLEKYKYYKKDQGLKNTSIKKNIVTIRAVYNAAIKENVIPYANPFRGVFDDLPIIKRRAKNFYLSETELKKMKTIKSDHKSYQRVIDLSLLQFYLGGADLVDVYFLKKEDLSGGRCFLTRRKNGQRAYEYDVKITDAAAEIIFKYRSDPVYVFPWRKSFEAYITFRNNHNRDLKKMQTRYKLDLLPKNGNLTTKVMRHTFATLAKFKHYDPDLIREVMGHERNDIDTIYKDKYPEAERDAMQMDVTNLNL